MEWISVKERLPEEGVPVLVLDYKYEDFPQYYIDYIVETNDLKDALAWGRCLLDKNAIIKYWMPLPEKPKDDDGL